MVAFEILLGFLPLELWISKMDCAQAMLAGDCRGLHVVICSDSQATLGALDGYLVSSREALRCRGLLREQARANSVSLLWVPGHSRVIGSEDRPITEPKPSGPHAVA